MEERRKFKRYKIPEVAGNLLFESEAELINVSLSGVAIEGACPLDLGRTYQVAVAFDEQSLELSGKVIWCEEAENDRYRSGVEFEDIWTTSSLQLLKLIQTKVLADLDTRLVRRFQSQETGKVSLRTNYDFLVKCISLSGMEIETDFWPVIDSTHDCEVSLRDSVLAVRTRIANVRHDNPRTNPLYQVGTEFENLTQDGHRILEDFIEEELAPKN